MIVPKSNVYTWDFGLLPFFVPLALRYICRLRWLDNKPYLQYGFFYVLFAGTFFPLHCITKRGGVYSAELTPLPLTLCIASGIVVSSKTERFGKDKKENSFLLQKKINTYFPFHISANSLNL
jgi:hypothetical protein